ncbi:hypothetical protein [Chryseobacterium indoltheticum]
MCSFTLYNNVAGAVAVVIRYGDEIYLTRRNQDEAAHEKTRKRFTINAKT